jgi:cytochrome b561
MLMISIKNTTERYGIGSISLHWLMAVLILGQIALGWYMSDLVRSPTKIKLIGLHKEIGILILIMVIIRISWRAINIAPSMIKLSYLDRMATQFVHNILYFFMFAVPISGWIMTATRGLAISFFGLFTLPGLAIPNNEISYLFNEIHVWLAYTLLFTIGLHVAGALKHHFIDKDTTLQRMLF